MVEKESKLTESEKAIINDIYNSVVQYAYSSHITSLIYRKYPEAFFKPSKRKIEGKFFEPETINWNKPYYFYDFYRKMHIFDPNKDNKKSPREQIAADTHTENIIVSTKTDDNVFYNHYVERVNHDK